MDYQRIYDEFIADRRAKEADLIASGEYKERHHVVPRSLGGLDDASNMVSLTAGDHYFAHLLLAKIHGGGMWGAVWATAGMNNRRSKRRVELYSQRLMVAVARKNMGKHSSEVQKGIARPQMSGENNPMRNPDAKAKQLAAVQSDDYRKKMSLISKRTQNNPKVQEKRKTWLEENKSELSRKAKDLWQNDDYRKRTLANNKCPAGWNKGQKMSEEQRKKLSEAHTGKTIGFEQRQKISKSLKGIKRPEGFGEKVSKAQKGISKPCTMTPEQLADRAAKTGAAQRGIPKPKTSGGKNGMARSIINLDTGEVFSCIPDALVKHPKAGNINAVCRGVRKVAGGYRWAYA